MKKEIKTHDAIFPMPVLLVATYNEDGTVNVMNAAWGTMVNMHTVALNLTETHKTVKNIKARGAFTVSLADADHLVEADYFGIASGNKVGDKLGKAGLTATKSDKVDAPVLNEFPVCMECEFIEYQGGEYGLGVIGKVVRTTVEEKFINASGVDVGAMNILAYDSFNYGYYKVSEKVGQAFSDGKKIK